MNKSTFGLKQDVLTIYNNLLGHCADEVSTNSDLGSAIWCEKISHLSQSRFSSLLILTQ